MQTSKAPTATQKDNNEGCCWASHAFDDEPPVTEDGAVDDEEASPDNDDASVAAKSAGPSSVSGNRSAMNFSRSLISWGSAECTRPLQ